MKKNLFIIAVAFVFVFTLSAENTLEKKKVDLRVIESSFSQRFEEIKEAIKKGDFEDGKLDQYYIIFKAFSENEYIEKATNIRKEYFVKTTEYLRKMNAMKKEIKRAEEIKDLNINIQDLCHTKY